MKAILEIPEKEIKFELDNFTYSQFRIVGTRSSEVHYMTEKYPIGEPITLITSNMTDELKEEIEEVVRRYCNH